MEREGGKVMGREGNWKGGNGKGRSKGNGKGK